MEIDWKRKLTSRKLWAAVAAFVSGLIMAFKGNPTTAETVGGVILQFGAVVGYVLAEGLVDAASAGAETNVTVNSIDDGNEVIVE